MIEQLNIKKILVSEDIESISSGIEKNLHSFMQVEITQVRYCDDAWLKLKKAEQNGQPFDLLITDLSFREDHRDIHIKNGEDLIRKIRNDGINCKIIVFSIEDKPLKIQSLFDKFKIDAYILKGRNDHIELQNAVKFIKKMDTYLSSEIKDKIRASRSLSQVEEIDLQIIQKLCEGKTQEEISQELQKNGIKPGSVSSIEKRLKNLRDDFSAKTNIELVIIFKDLGLI